MLDVDSATPGHKLHVLLNTMQRANIASSNPEDCHLYSFSHYTASSEHNSTQLATYYRRAGTSFHISRHSLLQLVGQC